MGAFFVGPDSTGAVAPFDQAFAQAVPDTENTIVVVYNHGTDWGGKFQDCRPGTMPGFVRDLGSSSISGYEIAVFYLCSQVNEKRGAIMGQGRSEENEALLDRLAVLGVPSEHIFVFGHSGGASTALVMAERASHKFNAAVVSAPGDGFAWYEQEGYPSSMLSAEYDRWRGRLAGAEDMNALVFVYDGDIYAPPDEALFLRDLPEVDVIHIRANSDTGAVCDDEPEPHFYWWSSCFENEQTKTIEDYMAERIAVGVQAAL